MSDLENMSETLESTSQPVDAVAAEAEEVTQPQSDELEELSFVEEEGEPNQSSNDDKLTKQRAAFAKSKKKQREEKERREAAEREVNELKEKVSKLEAHAKPPKPTFESCGYDGDELEKALNQYYKPTEAKPQQQAQQPKPVIDEEAEFMLYQQASDLKAQLKDYDNLEAKCKARFTSNGLDADVVVNELSFIAKQTGANAARAIAAFGSSEALFEELKIAASTGNQFAIADVVKKAADRIKPATRKKIDTKPEPTITNSGPIDNKAAAVAKARDAWVNASSDEKILKWNEYQAAKKT